MWGNFLQEGVIQHPLAAAATFVVVSDLDDSMMETDLAAATLHGDLRTDQLSRHAVVVGVDVHAGVVLHPSA
jgi:hypothetical protein